MTVACGKGLLYFYNLILVGISGAVGYLSYLFVSKFGDFTNVTTKTYTIIPAGLIAVFAIIILATGIVGCCGVGNANRCVLGTYLSLLIFLLAIQVVFGCLIYAKKNEVKKEMHANLLETFDSISKKNSRVKKLFEKIQKSLHCCGIEGPGDWTNRSMQIPSSCCIHLTGPRCDQFNKNVYVMGCFEKLVVLFDTLLKYVIGVLIGFTVFQIIGIIMTIYLIVVLSKSGYIRL